MRDLRVAIGGSRILDGVAFTVPTGGITALLGRNGAGKTTTLRALLGLVRRSGKIVLAGEEIGRLAAHEVVRRGVGYVPEDRDVFGGLTVAENLRLAERGPSPRYALVYELFPELRARAGQRGGTLSGGQQQMVAIARALLNANRILLVDEPTKGLAPMVVKRVIEVLADIAREVTILLVEQNLAVAAGLARHAVVLDRGTVAYAGSYAELARDPERIHRHLGVALAPAGP